MLDLVDAGDLVVLVTRKPIVLSMSEAEDRRRRPASRPVRRPTRDGLLAELARGRRRRTGPSAVALARAGGEEADQQRADEHRRRGGRRRRRGSRRSRTCT